MSSPEQCTLEEFTGLLRRARLDPAQHDVAELHAAWLLLESQMQRLQEPPAGNSDRKPGVQALGVFNPHDFVMTRDKTRS